MRRASLYTRARACVCACVCVCFTGAVMSREMTFSGGGFSFSIDYFLSTSIFPFSDQWRDLWSGGGVCITIKQVDEAIDADEAPPPPPGGDGGGGGGGSTVTCATCDLFKY